MRTLVWFRRDLRAADNPALHDAAARGAVLPVYIQEDSKDWPMGGASRWWLHHSLAGLQKTVPLVLKRGGILGILGDLVRSEGISRVVWNRIYDAEGILRDSEVKTALRAMGVEVESFNGSLLHEPWEVKNLSGTDFKVFTPFWKKCLTMDVPQPLPAPAKVDWIKADGDALADWNLLPTRPNWAKGWDDLWPVGEAGAREQLQHFFKHGLNGYGDLRNRADLPHTSRLSPHLHFGEISPRQIWWATKKWQGAKPGVGPDADKFLSEIGWREFAHHLLYHFPALPDKNWKADFDAYPWADDAAALKRWQRGQTGYPMVDAGMRELWHTGWMHNRVRMITASFLIKHLRMDWRHGERWFWDTLLDADLPNNAAGWQWVAGSGADASPYFRIFNPMEQGRKFDPNGDYVRRWCPELAKLPTEFIHAPWEASPFELAAAGVVLGKDYPLPMVDHASARAAALAGYKRIRGGD